LYNDHKINDPIFIYICWKNKNKHIEIETEILDNIKIIIFFFLKKYPERLENIPCSLEHSLGNIPNGTLLLLINPMVWCTYAGCWLCRLQSYNFHKFHKFRSHYRFLTTSKSPFLVKDEYTKWRLKINKSKSMHTTFILRLAPCLAISIYVTQIPIPQIV